MKKKYDETIKIDGCRIEWSVNQPYCLLMCYTGREDDLMTAIGHIFESICLLSPRNADNLAKLLFTNTISVLDVKYACDVCAEKGVTDIAYMFGILNNLAERTKRKAPV